MLFVEAIQRKRIVLDMQREGLDPQPQPRKPQRLPFNQYSQYVYNVCVVLFKPVLNSVSLVMYYMCTYSTHARASLHVRHMAHMQD